ncbi:ParB/Srx family N-terminal domain-containing protein [Nostoc sp. 106C]|uniref:ParB/Srx family N-terminal domain-containing protein n=1 Tax=Nostoc sp. 106C TaxID=1932667 RepID=UPI000A39003B|nr:ParB/Srx family N-terminal domain-containing protein [Nostoc sp. 106C]OUL34137.1 hypothetical protein BV375_05140 [Nostoc sp. 106C]
MLDIKDSTKKSSGAIVSESPLSSASRRLANPLSSVRPHASAPAVSLRQGDTLWEVAEKKLGSGDRWGELRKADGSRFTSQEAKRLPIGTRVYLPEAKPGVVSSKPVAKSITSRNNFNAATPSKGKAWTSISPSLVSQTSKVSSQLLTPEDVRRDKYLNPSNPPNKSSQSKNSSPTSNSQLNLISGAAKGIYLGRNIPANRLSSKTLPTEASRAAKPLVLSVTDENGKRLIKPVPLRRVRFSQGDISPQLRDKTPYKQVVEGMKKHGWDYTKEPPDMVKFEGKKLTIGKIKIPISRGHYTSLDNRRIRAAKDAGIKKIPARVHHESDSIRHDVPSKPGSAGKDVASRFKLKKTTFTDPKTAKAHKVGNKPSNWGEAAKFRAADQRARGYQDFPLTGKKSLPIFKPELPETRTQTSRLPRAVGATKSVAESGATRAVLRGASKIAAPVAVGLDVWQLKNAYQKDGFGKEFRKTAGSVAGGWGGAAAGAAIGSAIFPGVGTVVGGVVGGIAGSAWGDDIEQGAETVGKNIAGGAKKVWNKLFG